MDGGDPWVITRAVRRTTAEIICAYVRDTTVVDNNPATRTVKILQYKVPTQVHLGAP